MIFLKCSLLSSAAEFSHVIVLELFIETECFSHSGALSFFIQTDLHFLDLFIQRDG